VVHEAVDHGGGDDVVAEDLAPAIRGSHMFPFRDRSCYLAFCGLIAFC
jgi:hypothetical protein